MTNFVFYENPELAIICLPSGVRPLYSLSTTADLTGVPPGLLQHYCGLGLLGPSRADPEREPTFDDNALYEIRRIEHWRRHHGVSRQALPLVCELWSEIERLQGEVRFLRGP